MTLPRTRPVTRPTPATLPRELRVPAYKYGDFARKGGGLKPPMRHAEGPARQENTSCDLSYRNHRETRAGTDVVAPQNNSGDLRNNSSDLAISRARLATGGWT